MDKFRSILQTYWGYPDFRGIQAEIVSSIAAGHDTLGLMPTGGGKSITFQVPALSMEGICIVVTPLIALMKDQVAHLKQRNISAEAIYTGLPRHEIDRILDNSVFGAVKFLYVSPERLSSEIFLQKFSRMNVCFITVDEAHCISQWGYDFRPSYLQIAAIRKLQPQAPILALTATATLRVVEDIQARLSFTNAHVFRMSFERKNLQYIVRNTDNKENELLHILRRVEGSAIVYTRSRQGTQEIAALLNAEGICALNYHAGLSNLDKDVRQESWQEGETRVMVATNAFGMGIDKADVRVVIHMDFPDSIEAYFQEAGRAGRDGRRAFAVLLNDGGDTQRMLRRIPETYPPLDYVRKVYDHLGSYFQIAVGDGENTTREFSLDKFCINFRHFPVQAESALRLLNYAGYIEYREPDEGISRLIFIMTRDELYQQRLSGLHLDRVLTAVLRIYCGVFADYTNIEEDRIGKECGLTPKEVYEALRQLTFQRVLNYIPKKNTAYITYRQRREDGCHLHFPPSAYKERREQYERQVNAMISYATDEDKCRSHTLLAYFGEESAADCGTCDVCLSRKQTPVSVEHVAKEILSILADKRPHPTSDFAKIAPRATSEMKRQAWQQLSADNRISIVDGEVVLL